VLPVIVPLVAAVLYAAGSAGIQRSLRLGAGPRRVLLVSNIAIAAWSLVLWFVFPGGWSGEGLVAAGVAGTCLFAGRLLAVKALEAGDLSVVAPLLALKTLLVALLSILTGASTVDARLLVAAIAASAGVAMIREPRGSPGADNRHASFLTAASALLFAITDVAVQNHAGSMGIGTFTPAMFLMLCMLLPLLGRPRRAPREAAGPLLAGSIAIGFQTMLVLVVIGITGQATLVNVVYSTRSVWSVVADQLAGGDDAKRFFKRRLGGAVLVVAAVAIALIR
jgi:drug/metabolite transporter (DMT)-like permease